jgi:hypothetical protein
MRATEIDPRSVKSARTSVGGNSQLREQIHIWQVSASDRQRQRVEWSESGDDADINTVAVDVAVAALRYSVSSRTASWKHATHC